MLQQRVDERAEAMDASHGPWPCRAGCDACCRTLAVIPRVCEAEFEALAEAVEALPASVQGEIRSRLESLRPGEDGRLVCPLLDLDRGYCRVYEARPIACRTYGFYAGREGDYWCERVTAHLGDRRETLLAGNQIAMDARCDAELGLAEDIVTRFGRRWGA